MNAVRERAIRPDDETSARWGKGWNHSTKAVRPETATDGGRLSKLPGSFELESYADVVEWYADHASLGCVMLSVSAHGVSLLGLIEG